MRLIFVGDISVSQSFYVSSNSFLRSQKADLVLANLEGPLISEQSLLVRQPEALTLYNSQDVLKVLNAFNIKAVWLANNHTYDLRLPSAYTKSILARGSIKSFGAGANLSEASSAFIFTKDNTTVKIFSFGWDVIGCQTATPTSEGVNPFTPKHTLNIVRRLRSADDTSFLIFIMHWNYELEIYPQPAHRQLANDLIREGVDTVIGLHGHVAQGAELIGGKPAVYGLGNWFFPARQMGHLHLAYPPISSRELALELDIEGRQVRDVCFHWHQFDTSKNIIQHEKTEGWDGVLLGQLTPYRSVSHKEYVRWFSANRTRRRGLPIYKDYRHIWRNRIKDRYVKLRQMAIKSLVHMRLKGGPRV